MPAERDRPALAQAAGRLREAGVEVRLDASGDDLAARARTLIKSPGVPQDAPPIRAARDRGAVVLGELELAWRLIPNEFVAVTGTNGKTTTTEWIGHVHREAGLPVAVAGNVGTAASSLVDGLARRRDRGLRGVLVPARGHGRVLARGGRAAEPVPRPPRPSRQLRGLRAAKLRIFANQGNDDVAVAPADLGVEDLGGCARRVHVRRGPGPETVRARRLSVVGTSSRSSASTRSRCRARTTSERDGGGRGMPRARDRRRGGRDRPAHVRRRRATGSSGSRVHRRRHVRQRLQGDQRRQHDRRAAAHSPVGLHLIAGGRGKQQDFSPLAPLVAERCRAVYLIGEAAAELADALEPTGVPLHQAGDLEHAVAMARRGGRRRRGRAALAGLRELRPVLGLRGARRALPRAGGGRLMARAATARRRRRRRHGGSRRRRSDREALAARGPPGAAAARAPDPDDRDAVPARVRGGDGLQRLLAARRARRAAAAAPGEFVRYLVFGAIGLAAMHVLARRGLEILTPKLVNGAAARLVRAAGARAGSRVRRGRSTARGAGSRPGRSSSSPPS